MLLFNEYIITERLQNQSGIDVFRASKDPAGTTVVVKVIPSSWLEKSEFTRYRGELELWRKLKSVHIVKILEVIPSGDDVAIVIEDFYGFPLNHLVETKQNKLILLLGIAIQICKGLSAIHSLNMIHGMLSPADILLNENEDLAKIAMPIRCCVRAETRFNSSDFNYLYYRSPELADDDNSSVDQRSDLYSFGVILYHLFVGELPFSANNLSELIQAHRSSIPTAPLSRIHLPSAISDIIIRLLMKKPEDRYQNADSLLWDLEKAQSLYFETGDIPSFPLGTKDHSGSLHFTGRIYGREKEKLKIRSVLEKGLAGKKRALFLSGRSGIGKTSLVRYAVDSFPGMPFLFVTGKFDIVRRNIPYFAVSAAMKGMVHHILNDNKENLNRFQNSIQAKLGPRARLISELAPDILQITGDLSDLPVLPPLESRIRFEQTLVDFFSLFISRGRLLVLFLDDLQWGDTASFQFLHQLLTKEYEGGFVFIGAYRKEDLLPDDPLDGLIRNIQQRQVDLIEIHLEALNHDHITEILKDVLGLEEEENGVPLADQLILKTNGNPFLLQSLLKELFARNLLYYNNGRWEWNVDDLEKSRGLAADRDILSERMNRLPFTTIDILTTAACLGGDVSIRNLSVASGIEEDDLYVILQTAMEQALLRWKGNDRIAFIHDRVLETAYSLLGEDDKHYKHLACARNLQKKLDLLDSEQVFLAADQYLRASHLLAEESEKIMVAELCLTAGRLAGKSSTAGAAITYYRFGVFCLPENAFYKYYSLSVQLHREAAEMEYALGNFDESLNLLEIYEKNIQTTLEKTPAVELKISIYTSRYELDKAVQTGLDLLNQLGAPIPGKFPWWMMVKEYLYINYKSIFYSLDSIIDLPEIENQEKDALIRILGDTFIPAYITGSNISILLALKIVSLSSKYGNSIVSPFGYTLYGVFLSAILRDFKNGERYGRLSIELSEKLNSPMIISRTIFIYSIMIHHWTNPMREGYPLMLRSVWIAQEHGYLELASYSLNQYFILLILSGANYDFIIEEFRNKQEQMLGFNQDISNGYYYFNYQFVVHMNSTGKKIEGLSGDIFDEKFYVKRWSEVKNDSSLVTYYLMNAIILYMFGKYEESLKSSTEGIKLKNAILGMPGMAYLHIFQSLAASVMYRLDQRKSEYRKIFKKNLRHLRYLNRQNIVNYYPSYRLLLAENSILDDENQLAEHYYVEAMEGFRETGMHLMHGVACERYADAFREYEVINREMLREARDAYQRQGALAVASRVEKEINRAQISGK